MADRTTTELDAVTSLADANLFFVVVSGVPKKITRGNALGALPATTLGGTVSGGGNQINNVVIGTSTPLAGTFTTLVADSLRVGPSSLGAADSRFVCPVSSSNSTYSFEWGSSTFFPVIAFNYATFSNLSISGFMGNSLPNGPHYGLGVVSAGVGSVGVHNTGGPMALALAAAVPGFRVIGASGQSADLHQWIDYDGNLLARVTPAGWIQNAPGRARVASDVTNATTTMAAITGLSVTVVSGRKYAFKLTLFVANSVAADGVKIDFDGGAATMTNFRAHGLIHDAALLASTQTTALATDILAATVTGDAIVEVSGAFVPSSTGTFAVRGAMNAATTGTVTFALGSNLWVEDMP